MRRPAKLLSRGTDIDDSLVARLMTVGLIIGGVGCALIGLGYLIFSTSSDTGGIVFAGLLLMYGLGQTMVGIVLRNRGGPPPRPR